MFIYAAYAERLHIKKSIFEFRTWITTADTVEAVEILFHVLLKYNTVFIPL